MSYDYVCDEEGRLEIIVSRYYNRTGDRREIVYAYGFEPYEPVSVEVCGEEESKAVKPIL